MILISQELFADFQAITLERFIQKKLNTYAENNPAAYDTIGDENYRSYVESAIERAEHCGLDAESDIDIMLSLMDNLGWNFNSDPLFKWAHLNEKLSLSQAKQSVRLLKELLEVFVIDTHGESGQILEAALRRFMILDLRMLTDISSSNEILRRINVLYPEKFARVGGANFVSDFLPVAREKAVGMGMFSYAGVFLVSYAMFMLGFSFESDPRYQAAFDPDKFSPPPEQAFMKALRKHFAAGLENMERQKRL